MSRPLCYLNTGKKNAAALMGAFAEGSGAEVTTVLEFKPGREAVFWGIDRATLPIWNKVVETGTPFWYVDNGYFMSRWSGGNYYRVTRDAEQHTGEGVSDGARWRALNLKIAPWTMGGDYILVACQSDFWHERHGDGSAAQFGEKVKAELAKCTKRRAIVRGKPIGGHVEPPLEEQIRGAWATVAFSSIVAGQGLLAGVPAFMLAPGAMGTVASLDLSEIERPYRPADRERWAGVLADNQWTLDEIRNGVTWKALSK
ncbi:MAG: hypothetical protein NUV34_01110 [Sulfuricaulis sp.]|nr:hypothetical protein [Sulfuricaulis sp.]